MVFRATAAAAEFLEQLAQELEVPQERYKEAEERYHSVGDWLGRDESSIKDYSPNVYVQGSFRLGTPIRPLNGDEHYDIDLVCELSLGKSDVSQKDLKAMLGKEMQLYAKNFQMAAPVEGKRCWTLDYAKDAQFHLDALPAIPDGEGRRIALESMQLSSEWSSTAIAITDNEHESFSVRTDAWPHSNPLGFTEWFRSRMRDIYLEKRLQIANESYASVEDVPSYAVKTPLQQVVQILKRHRDIRFSDRPDVRPISVIITTLAALAYSSQTTLPEALSHILLHMDKHICMRNGVIWIENPTDAAENFADRWEKYPERQDAFFEWLRMAREDFKNIAESSNLQLAMESASYAVGANLAKRAGSAVRPTNSGISLEALNEQSESVYRAPHREAIKWPVRPQGKARIAKVRAFRNGFRPTVLVSDAGQQKKGVSIEFAAKTDVAEPYSVYWQIVNTGQEAKDRGNLRGEFSDGVIVKGDIVRTEETAYRGTHSVECFIVKDGMMAARTGAFIVHVM